MRVAVVGRGRLGAALAAAVRTAGHEVVALRRRGARARDDGPVPEAVLDAGTDWLAFGLVLLAFETHAASLAELERDEALRELRRIPAELPVASVVMSPPPELLDAFLPGHTIAHFLTTPAARLPGAVALLRRTPADTAPLRAALPALHWVEADDEAYGRLGRLLIGSALAAAALAHLGRVLGVSPREAGVDYLDLVLDDAKRLLRLAEGDGFAAFSLVATPGGFTERAHDAIFATRWPLAGAAAPGAGEG